MSQVVSSSETSPFAVQNKLLLSLIANNLNYEEILNAFLFYKEGLVILMNDNNNWLEYSANKMEHDKVIKDMFLKFMKDTGSDIQDIKTKSERRVLTSQELPKDMPPAIRAMVLNQPTIFTTVKTIYKGFSLDIAEESMGTQKLIRLMYPIMDIFQKDKTFVCDEIESHLHYSTTYHTIYKRKGKQSSNYLCNP